MDTPFFELRNVSKYFARVVANKDISFSIQRGEVLALLGENWEKMVSLGHLVR